MRFVWVMALTALLSGVGLSLPASASPRESDSGDSRVVSWSEVGPRFERRRVARATINDAEEDYEARPRRSYERDSSDRPRYKTQQRARKAERSRRGRHASQRSSRKAAHRDGRRTVRNAARREQRRVVAHGYGGGMQGVASYYWQGQRVATGARFNPEGLTAAHRTLPFGTRVRVTHLGNGRSVDVTINDRGPFIAGRIIDLARGAARVIGMTGQGLARVRVTVLSR